MSVASPVPPKALRYSRFARIENVISLFSLFSLALLSFAEIVSVSVFKASIPYAAPLVSHLTLLFSCFASVMAGREGKQLGLGAALPDRGLLPWLARSLAVFLKTTFLVLLALTALSMACISFDYSQKIAFIPLWIFTACIPLAFIILSVRSVAASMPRFPVSSALGLLAALWFALSALVGMGSMVFPELPEVWWTLSDASVSSLAFLRIPLVFLLVLGAFCGVPLFVVLSGIALVAFGAMGGPLEPVSYQAYPMFTGSFVPALPLFTLAGILLAESKAGQRLVTLVKYAIGWIRGGPAVAAVLVSAFFTSFTGASGVTILALGGLLMLILKESRFGEERALGLLTASGAIGLLFPPSLAIIIYGSVSQVNIMHLFIGGALPGALLVLAMVIAGIILHRDHQRAPFEAVKTLHALKDAIGELLLPVLVIVGYFSGFFTLVQTGAFTVLYVFVLVVLIRRDIPLRAFPAAALKSVPVIGGVLIILASAQALKDWLVDARIPMLLADWAAQHISSPFVFLAALNLVLLLVGCLMDIFSAILVVAPLVIPVASQFGIDPVHLGVLFLANMSLGFLTPPIGMNLFIASYTFELPLSRVYRAVWPFFLVQLAIILLITYVPFFTLAFISK